MTSSRRPRAADVAKAAGVSTATVSYVLNNTPGQTISLKTQEKVRKAALDLGYVSNVAAQTLARGRSSVAVVDLSEFVTHESAQMASIPIARTLRSINFEPFVTLWPINSQKPSRVEQLVQFARATRPELILTLLPLPEATRIELYAAGVSNISSFGQSYYDFIPYITSATTAQIEYLHSQGHTSVLFVGTGKAELEPIVSVREMAGKAKASDLGMSWTSVPRYNDMPHLIEVLGETISQTGATAICAYNDDDALSALFALNALGIKCPQEMALIGVDNEKFTARTYPALTTVSFDFESFGEQSISTDGMGVTGKLELMENALREISAIVIPRESA